MSLLDQLKARRAEIAKGVHFTVKVPRWTDPSVAVRFEAPDSDELDRAYRRLDKAKTGHAKFDINSKFLAGLVTDVFVIDDTTNDAEPVSFDQLAAALDIPASPQDALKALFFTQPDMLATLDALAKWAGEEGERVDDDLLDEVKSGN